MAHLHGGMLIAGGGVAGAAANGDGESATRVSHARLMPGYRFKAKSQ